MVFLLLFRHRQRDGRLARHKFPSVPVRVLLGGFQCFGSGGIVRRSVKYQLPGRFAKDCCEVCLHRMARKG